MNLFQYTPVSIRCRIPVYKVKRWWCSFRSAAFDVIVVVGLALAFSALWYFFMFEYR